MNVKEDSIICKECGWIIPEELFVRLLEGENIFCEKCGVEILKEDYNLQNLSYQKEKQSQKGLVELLALARKKSIEYKNKIKLKFDEFREKTRSK